MSLGENIKILRKKKNLSQEELAQRVHVVRQTISKWENGVSVPNAEEVIKLAGCLDVSVHELLGVEDDVKEREKRLQEAGKVRGAIWATSFAAVILSFCIGSEIGAMITAAGCCIAALIILYNNLGLLTTITADNAKLGPLKITTIFNISIIAACTVIAVLIKIDIINLAENGEKFMAALIVSIIIFFTGYISPKLPFNRHTGMRLPWTVTDEETWNVAHQMLGITAAPTGVVYLGMIPLVGNFEFLTAAAIFIWIAIPAGASLIYFWRKFH